MAKVHLDDFMKPILINESINARKSSYCPYSNYAVGAAIYCEDGSIVTGCNIENASYGATNCAERTAAFKAVSEGKTSFVAISICGSPKGDGITDYAFPCGICRQVLREFSNPDELIVIVAKSVSDYKQYTLAELLPNSFGPENLEC